MEESRSLTAAPKGGTSWRRWRFMAASALILLMTWALSSCQMHELTQVQSARFPHPQACAECHVEIYQEWQQSPHASAFTNIGFRQATDDYRFAECLGCHTPEPQLTSRQPIARESGREAGVACVACHLNGGAMVGPLEPTGIVKPHPVRVDPVVFEDGNLCGRCHEGTLLQWRATPVPNKLDCRQCHMPAVTRKITQATSLISRPLVAAETAAVEHRHLFSLTPDELKDGPCTLAVTRDGAAATIQITNLLPHDLPTGDFGVRNIVVAAKSVDEHGNASSLGQWELTRAGNAALPGGQSRSWRVSLDPRAKSIALEVTRQGREPGDRVVILHKEFAIQ